MYGVVLDCSEVELLDKRIRGPMVALPGEEHRKIKVLLVEDHAVVREGTAELINRQLDMTVVGEAGDGHQAVELAARLNPDVILMDVALPGLDGISATRQIKRNSPTI